MVKPRIKVREIKKDIKVTEIKKEESSLETKVQLDSLSPIVASARAVNPTLSQHFIPQFSQETRKEVREGIQSKDREFSYASMMSQPTRSYDPSIKSARAQFLEAQPTAAERVNPTIRSNNPLMESQGQSRNVRDNLNPVDTEPALRRVSGEKDYRAERADKYVAKRRTE